MKENTTKVIETLSKHGFDVHVHSKWLFRDYVAYLFGDKIVLEDDDGNSLCRTGTLSVDGQPTINLTVSAHKSQWFRNGGHVLIVDCIRSALKSGDVDFAKAGARNSANSVLLNLTEKFAEKVKKQLENDDSLKNFFGIACVRTFSV